VADPLPEQATMPHMPDADSRDHTVQSGTPAFIPGTIHVDIGDDDTNIETLLKRLQDSEPPSGRRARPSDGPWPKTSQPDFWIRRRRDD
jgi:hypothetical protein